MKGVSEKIKSWWERFQKKRPRLAKWVYQIGCFFGFSMGVTVFQYLVFTFMPGILGNETGRNRVYVSTDSDEDFRRGVYTGV